MVINQKFIPLYSPTQSLRDSSSYKEKDGCYASAGKLSASDRELVEALSGYGRELFFSNILDYIANHCPAAIKSALKEYLPEEGYACCRRENKHMDMVFLNEDKMPVLVIENKRGAIATTKQLKKYREDIDKLKANKQKKNSGCSFLLISPHYFEEELAHQAGWEFMGYAELGERLNSAIRDMACNNHENAFKYQLLDYVTTYMSELEAESTMVYNSVTPNTPCAQLRSGNEPMDHIKLRYCAMAHMLTQRIKENGLVGVDACFDPGVSSPLVNMEIKEMMETPDGKVNFTVQFQGDCLSVGFGREGIFAPLNKEEKKKERQKEWDRNDFAKVISDISNGIQDFSNYSGSGYMTTKYILAMYRIDVRERTVNEIIEMMLRFAVDALRYSRTRIQTAKNQ